MPRPVCLIVDDEPAIRTYLRAILEAGNVQCLEAENAPAALRIVHRLEGHIDAVLTDVNMPGDMNGIHLAHSVRTSFPWIRVILVTGSAGDEAVERASAVFMLIRKPVAAESILRAVDQGANQAKLAS